MKTLNDNNLKSRARVSAGDHGAGGVPDGPAGAQPLVFVLDHDPSVSRRLARLLADRGWKVKGVTDADGFLKAGPPRLPSCLVLENQLANGASGIEVHEEIVRRGWNLPTLFLTEQRDVDLVVRAIRGGADDFITKPFEPEEMVAALDSALEHARRLQREHLGLMEARNAAQQLTDREREVVRLVCRGLLNKEIADSLGLALVTVKVHRSRAMRKLRAGNAAELARIAAITGILD